MVYNPLSNPQKTAFKLFDFFGNCEYFETEFNYDEVLTLPQIRPRSSSASEIGPVEFDGAYEHLGPDTITAVHEETVGLDRSSRHEDKITP